MLADKKPVTDQDLQSAINGLFDSVNVWGNSNSFYDVYLYDSIAAQFTNVDVANGELRINGANLVKTSDMQAALTGKLASSVTKAELNTAVSDGNVVYVGDGLNGTLGATTPSTVAATTINASGTVTATSTGSHVFGTTNTVTMAAGNLTATGMVLGSSLRVGNSNGQIDLSSTTINFSNCTAIRVGSTLTLKTTGAFRNSTDTADADISCGGITLGAGTKITKVLSATATLDFGSITANSYADLTITVTGAAVGDTVAIGFPNGSILADLVWSAWVSATNTITVRVANNSSTTARDPASGTFRATVTQF